MIETGSYEEFLNRYSELIDSLAAVGWTPSEAFTRLTTIYPQACREHVVRALNSDRWTFVGRKEHLISNTMVAAALWYAVGVTHDLKPDPQYTAVCLDPAIIEDVPRLFEAAGVDQHKISLILSRIGAALKYLSENPYTGLDQASYDDFLADLPDEAQNISDEVINWPPSRFLVEDRLGDGSWSQALLRVGICPPDFDELELSLEQSSVSDRAFRNALGEFLSYCIRYDRRPTVLLYGSWSISRAQLGRVPLLGAVRGKYGSWYRALKLGRRLVNDALKMSSASAVPASAPSMDPPSSTGALRIEDLNAQGIGVVETPISFHKASPEKAWADLAAVMLTRLQELPWTQSMRLYYICPDVVEAEDYTPYVRIMRSPSGYLCELTALDEFVQVFPDYDTFYLLNHGWVEPRKNGYHTWTQNFLDVNSATSSVVNAMRFGMGCDRPDYFQSDDPARTPPADVLDPSANSIPMVPSKRSTRSISMDKD
ncbi:MAG: hypothetical protein Q4C74_02060 [Rothia sp. (in: high G+C Gram-positive bacteria)]|nr:hypothetical protein [Rothia sp. (in: high G+C Gram-positive bacteria)]